MHAAATDYREPCGRMRMTTSGGCPRCTSSQVDEYTHTSCPPGSTPDDHRHWVCANKACEHEWIEAVPG